MRSQLDILAEVTRKLEAMDIPYMLTGSLAQNYYAIERMTADVDIIVEMKPEHVPRFVGEFEKDYYVSPEAVLSAVRKRSLFNVIHLESIIKVDCILKKDSEYAEVAFGRRQQVEVSGVRTFVVSKEDLILSKLMWAKLSESEMQLRDVRNLLSTGYDKQFVQTWAQQLDVEELLTRCRCD